MLLNWQTTTLILTVRCLFTLWLFFGCLELTEQLHFLPETLSEDQQGQDLDEEALTQLASGLKSDITRLFPLTNPLILVERSEPTTSLPFSTLHPGTALTAARFLPLYQQFSVYRI
jgi:hypothetical protein